ncbi:MAG: hypothetical protein J6X10_03110 [Bacteroidales bacterium]|nr:hypothetical protein [Bacteroidales bacterium]
METNKIQNWNRTTEAIYKNVLLYSIAGMAASLFGMIPLMGWLADICNILVVAGFIAFFIRIKDLTALVGENDIDGMNKVKNGILIYILALMLKKITVIGWVLGPIGFIVSCVFLLLGYNALKKSETFPGKDGMKLLFIAMIIGIVGGVLAIIPALGTILGGICFIVEFVLVLLGWKKVAIPVEEARVEEAKAE